MKTGSRVEAGGRRLRNARHTAEYGSGGALTPHPEGGSGRSSSDAPFFRGPFHAGGVAFGSTLTAGLRRDVKTARLPPPLWQTQLGNTVPCLSGRFSVPASSQYMLLPTRAGRWLAEICQRDPDRFHRRTIVRNYTSFALPE